MTEIDATYLNHIPENWAEERLGDFVLYEKGKKPKVLVKQQNDEYKYPYINIKAFEQKVFTEFSNGLSGVMCSEEDFLLVWDGARPGLVGKGITGLVGSTLAKINFPGIYNEYAYYYLKSKYHEINTNAKGTGIPHVNPDLLWNYRFPIPPLTEQHRIVEKIEELFSEIDKGIEYLQSAKEQIKIYRQAVLKAAFEGSLTNHTYKKRVALAKLIVEEPRYGTSKKCTYDNKGLGVIRIPNIGEEGIIRNDLKYAQFNQSEIKNLTLLEGDLLIIRSNGSITLVGKVALVRKVDTDLLFAGYLIRLRPNRNIINSSFLRYYFNSNVARNYIETRAKSTSGVHNINAKEIKGLEVPLFEMEAQHQIVQEIESRLSVCDHMEETITDGLAQAESLKQSILKKSIRRAARASRPIG